MCVAILQPAGARTITEDRLELGWSTNPDGGGFAYVDGGDIVEFHSMDFEDFKTEYIKAHNEYGALSPFIVHMRITTHGETTLKQTHPFIVEHTTGHIAFAHNGIIHDCTPAKKDTTGRSDTMIFRDKFLKNFGSDWLDRGDMRFMVEHMIGWSKLVFIHTLPELSKDYYILNEQSGDWVDGSWYSNDSCEAPKFTYNGWTLDGWDNWDDDWYPMRDHYRSYPKYDDNGNKKTDNVILFDPTTGSEGIGIAARSYAGLGEDELELYYEPAVIRNASINELEDMVREVHKEEFFVCDMCFNVGECACEDICFECHEHWVSCDCSGYFISIMERIESLTRPDRAYDLDSTEVF